MSDRVASLGFDVGGTHLRACLWHGDDPPSDLIHRRWRDGSDPSPEQLARAVREAADELLAAASWQGPTPAVGVGIAAQLDAAGRVARNAPNLGWRDVPIADVLESGLGLEAGRVLVVNDLDAILAGERACGVARGVDDVVACYVGTGVGGAIVAGGRRITGASGTAGEIGHVKLLGCDAPCGCGERGCVEAVAGGAALDRRLARDSAPGGPAAHLATGADPIGVDRVDAAARAGDGYACALWDEVAAALGVAIAGACTLLNPELLVLGGGVLTHAPVLRDLVGASATELTLAVSRSTLRVEFGALGESAGALGSAWMGRQILESSGAP